MSASYDYDYKRIDFEMDDCLWDDQQGPVTLNNEYYHENETDFVKRIFRNVINFIFDYENKNYSTIAMSEGFVNKYQIELRPYFQPFIIRYYDDVFYITLRNIM